MLVRLSERTREIVVLGGAAIVPIVFMTRFNDVFGTTKFVTLSIVVGLGVALSSLAVVSDRRTPRPTVTNLVLCFITWEVICTLWSRAPAVSLLGLYGRYDGLASLVLMVLMASLVVSVCWTRQQCIDGLVTALLGAAVVAALYVWLQQLDLDWNQWYTALGRPVPRPQGVLGNSNFSGAHLAMALPLAVGTAARFDGWSRTAVLGVIPLLVGAIWFTGSRGAIIAAVIGCGVAGLTAPGAMPRRAATALCALGAAGFVASGILIVFGASWIPAPLSDLSILRTESLDVRRQLWPAALRTMVDHPLLGTGPDTFVATFLEQRGRPPAGFGPSSAAEPHNIWLDHAVSSGLIGAGLMIAIVVIVMRPAVRAPRQALLGGFTGMLAAYLAQGMFSVDTVGLTVLAWIAMAAIVVLSDPRMVAPAQIPESSGRSSATSPLTLAGTALLLAAWLTVAVRPIQADLAVRSASRDDGDTSALADLRRAADLVPIEPEYHIRLGKRLVTAATATAGTKSDLGLDLLDEAEAATRRSLDLFPQRVPYLHVLSDVELARAQLGERAAFDRALDVLDEARVADPFGWPTFDRLGAVTAAMVVGSEDRVATARTALEYYQRSAELNPDRIETWRAIATLAALVSDGALVDRAGLELERLTEQ